jgi:cellobiose transport system permease protein
MSLSVKTPPASPASVQPPRRPGQTGTGGAWLNRLDLKGSPYLYIAPFFLIFGAFGAYPMLRTIYMSLNKWDLVNERTQGHTFVGLKNYVDLVHAPYFWNAVENTFGMFAVATVPQLALALFLANLLNRPLKARTFLRMTVLVPNVTSVAAVAIVFGTLFQRDFGVINWVLHFFGVSAVDWHAYRWSQWTAIATMVDWRWTGYNTLILLAGMQAIPRDIYESAALDGAGAWRQFWSLTLPMLRPTFLFVTVTSIVGGLQLFTEPLLFNHGSFLAGNSREGQTLTLYMWENSLENTSRAGYGAAVAVALFLMIILMALFNFLLVRKTVKTVK